MTKWKIERAQKLVLEDALNNLKTDHERVLQMLEMAKSELEEISMLVPCRDQCSTASCMADKALAQIESLK